MLNSAAQRSTHFRTAGRSKIMGGGRSNVVGIICPPVWELIYLPKSGRGALAPSALRVPTALHIHWDVTDPLNVLVINPCLLLIYSLRTYTLYLKSFKTTKKMKRYQVWFHRVKLGTPAVHIKLEDFQICCLLSYSGHSFYTCRVSRQKNLNDIRFAFTGLNLVEGMIPWWHLDVSSGQVWTYQFSNYSDLPKKTYSIVYFGSRLLNESTLIQCLFHKLPDPIVTVWVRTLGVSTLKAWNHRTWLGLSSQNSSAMLKPDVRSILHIMNFDIFQLIFKKRWCC